jgi:DNA helicase-2/ATP-dependent DNA helicase PcrA
MPWDEGLTPEQITAASHVGAHARLLAGPGTGKTRVLTHRVLFLIEDRQIPASEIVVLTFTRAAARELRLRLQEKLGAESLPRVSTLHAFALRHLLRNSRRVENLPQPIRIADDWEERYIVQEDLKRILGHTRIRETQELFAQMAADWESLQADAPGYQPNPAFIGAWSEHRRVLGYTLRSELTYRLKRSLEQVGDFTVDLPIRHLLIDEYQDLNRCDLAVIRGVVEKTGAELYVAGDDDQSIYGFRKAHPDGIRAFNREYPGARDLPLSICKRCDPSILSLGEFIAALDPARVRKVTRPDEGRVGGEVSLLRFSGEAEEARAIALLCNRAVEADGFDPGQILVLLRVDTRGAFSAPIHSALATAGVPAAVVTAGEWPFDQDDGRLLLAFLRLLQSEADDLAWHTVLRLRRNGVGEESLARCYAEANRSGSRFCVALRDIASSPTLHGDAGARIARAYAETAGLLVRFAAVKNAVLENEQQVSEVMSGICGAILGRAVPGAAMEEMLHVWHDTRASSLRDLLDMLMESDSDIEQELEPGKVNVLTMHKAKGLTADVVFIAAAEDEHIPGKQETEPELGDERRLLFVSVTRARHRLQITYCDRRTGQQKMLGRSPGIQSRTLTRFLRDAPIHAAAGSKAAEGLVASSGGTQ